MPDLSALLQDLADDLVRDRADPPTGVNVERVRHRVHERRHRRERQRWASGAAALVVTVVVVAALIVTSRSDETGQVSAVAPTASSPGAPFKAVAPPSVIRGQGLTAALQGRTFLSRTATEAGLPKILAEDEYYELSFSSGTVGLNATCFLPGPFRIEDTTLVAILGSDPSAHCSRNEWLGTLIQQNPILSLTGERLTVTAGATQIEFVDFRRADPLLRWDHLKEDQVIMGEIGGVALPAGMPAGVFIGVRSRDFMTLGTGCTEAQVDYSFDGRWLTIKSLWLSPRLRDCAPDVEAAERTIVEMFSGAVSVEFEELTVVFRKDDRVLRYRLCQRKYRYSVPPERQCY